MQRPSYTVVALTVLVFAGFAVIKRSLMRFVPPATSNSLVGSPLKFLAAAGHQPIRWQTVDQNPFRARADVGKPILLVIGISGSKAARQMDEAVFGDSEIARSLSTRFLCIRIDGFDNPEWVNAVLPISRLRQRISTAFQVWLLGSNGHVLANLTRKDIQQTGNLWRWFDTAQDLFRKYGAPESRRNPFFDQQQLDLDFLRTPRLSALPSFPAATKVLFDACNFQTGGFPSQGAQGLVPNAWRFLALTGDSVLFKASLDPVLVSSMVDLQDGGFFNVSESQDFKGIDLDKITKRNAEMMETLALQGQIEQNPVYKELALRTFDSLIRQVTLNGLLAACQMDDSNSEGRSPRLSFPNWRLRDTLADDDAAWARQNFDLEPLSNPQMLPRLKSTAVLVKDRKRCLSVLGKMRASTQDLPILSDKGYLDVNGHSVARMLDVCRLFADSTRLKLVRPVLSKLERFRLGSTVFHSAEFRSPSSSYLGDYLAYADAKLQEYLCLGDASSLTSGLEVFLQATNYFQGSRPGEFDLSANPLKMGGLKNFCVPEISDNLGESCSAQMARLALDYGRMTADSPIGEGFLKQAKETVSLFANLVGSAGTLTGGYMCAAAEVGDDQYALTVGPDARSLADELYRKVPARFVAPVLGAFRPDIRARGPGVYVVGKTIEGPFSVEEAARLLPATLVTRPQRAR